MANADTQTTGSTVTGSTLTGITANQAASEYTEIRTASELVEAAKTATGNYKLMTDVDMTGIEWTPWDFSGTFDGNGHSILNLSVKTVSKHTMMTYDGNRKEYETYGSGFFGVLKDSKVTGLNIYGARVEVTSTEPCFAAPVAGLADNSDISDCIIKEAGCVSTTHKLLISYGCICINADKCYICSDVIKIAASKSGNSACSPHLS